MVIATGGGAITREKNYIPLHQNGEIIFIERDLEMLARDGRPLSIGNDLSKMYENRLPLYKRFSDATVKNDGYALDVSKKIIDAFVRL
jgi:shikimate dehydrogenase